MDDLSINISGIAPAAARTAAAVSKTKTAKVAGKAKVKSVPKTPKTKAKTSKPKQLELASNYASKVKDWRKNRFQKDQDSGFTRTAGVVEFNTSKKRKNKPKPAEAKTSGKRQVDDVDAAKGSAKIAKGKDGKAKVKPGERSPKAAKRQKTGGSTKGRVEKLEKGTGVVSEMKFQSLKLHDSLRRQLEYLNFTDCTPIQSLAIPRALTGKRDVLLRAPTGSGKTLAFVIPVVHQLLTLPGGVDRRSLE